MTDPLTIWLNAGLPERAMGVLQSNIAPHKLVIATQRNASNLVPGAADPLLEQADVAYGQPDPKQVVDCPRLKWIHLTTAGYTRYDSAPFREAMRARNTIVTNSSAVYDAPCAEHILAMMLSLARQLPQALDEQRNTRAWSSKPFRARSRLLDGQTAIIYGFGSIARRLVELLAPLRLNMVSVRRTVRGDETVRMVTATEADALLPQADHVIDILPAAEHTDGFFSAERLARIKRGAIFYNIGRGATVDQNALQSALQNGNLAAAYLDVTNPEPLPPDHPLWSLPNCFITPHTAGGSEDEFDRGVRHFLDNLHRFTAGHPLINRVI
ncbi:MAG TPA: D-2-hydroxyacid dehydrogenase [Tepidisphaeraceae bacterium]|nr:D-2-hydroxyacid dehydrogenase [Tepidisphaeraceae bacterium]